LRWLVGALAVSSVVLAALATSGVVLAAPPLALRTQESAPAPLAERALFGLYAAGAPYYTEATWALERRLGARAEVISGFVDWEYVFGEARDLALSLRGRRKLLYSWEPHCAAAGEPSAGGSAAEPRCIRFSDVIAGAYDGYFARIAESMARFPGEIYVRPWAEMNAPWSAWLPGSGRPRAGTREEFKAAWRHLVGFFRARGVRNLRFVFSPDAAEDASTVPVAELWPGQEFVDLLGIDGYNWGDGGPRGKSSWREFEAIFADMYRRLTALHPTAPVWICEFGSKEPLRDDGTPQSPAPKDPRHDKARWLERALGSREFPRIEALVFYSKVPAQGSYRRDFRVDSSPASLAATARYARLRARLARRRARE
jgi:hypothetical protein